MITAITYKHQNYFQIRLYTNVKISDRQIVKVIQQNLMYKIARGKFHKTVLQMNFLSQFFKL